MANGNHRRSALWEVERATRFAGPLLEQSYIDSDEPAATEIQKSKVKSQNFPDGRWPRADGFPTNGQWPTANGSSGIFSIDNPSPLSPMTDEERLVADFHGMGLTVGPHPMAYRRQQMRNLGVSSAAELQRLPQGKRVKTAGCVICRQRPGTAKGFVFLSLEDETGISNAIVMPDLFDHYRFELISEKFLLIEGRLQNQDGVVSVKAEHIAPLSITAAETTSHDFH